MTLAKEIKDSMKEKKTVMGTREVVKNSKKGALKAIIYSSSIPQQLKNDIEHYSKLSKAELKPFGEDSVKLGQICGKPFKILAIGIKK